MEPGPLDSKGPGSEPHGPYDCYSTGDSRLSQIDSISSPALPNITVMQFYSTHRKLSFNGVQYPLTTDQANISEISQKRYSEADYEDMPS